MHMYVCTCTYTQDQLATYMYTDKPGYSIEIVHQAVCVCGLISPKEATGIDIHDQCLPI